MTNGAESQAQADTQVDVIVVGAGISGLATARQLHGAGRSVVVLESRDRVGGRLLSHRLDDGQALDLGATWFWPNEPRIQQLIADLGLDVHRQYLDGDALYHDPKGTQRIEGNPLDVESGRLVGGTQSLPQAIADELPEGTVRLGVAVDNVMAHDDGVQVMGNGETWAAGHVVLALPPALAVHRIDFKPTLPGPLAQLAARTPVWMGAIAKFVVIFDRAFWRERGLAGAAISHYGPLREIHDMCGPDGSPAALFGFAPLRHGFPTPSTEDVVAQLTELFGADMPVPLDVVVADWRAESATSPPQVENHTDYSTFGHPAFAEPVLGGRVHWASTETSPVAPGHIEGALASAQRVATGIIGS